MPASTTGRPAAVLSILVTTNTRSAQAQLAALDRQLAYSVKRAGAGTAAIQRSLVGLRYAAVGSVAAIGGSVAAAANYETAFANVKKTVEATRPQLARLHDDFIDLSKSIPTSASELANLAGEAGALGVEAKDLRRFTKTAAQLGATTQLSAEMAADGLARVANIMDLDVGKSVRGMSDVLVDLGNKGASTEGEILEMSKRIAGSGKVIGLTETEVLGLSAGLANLGIRAEMGGSAISRVMRGMHVAIREGPSKELSLFAETAGMTVDEFSTAFEDDAVGAIGHFIDGLAQIEKDGGSAQGVLLDLGKAAHTSFGEIRISDTLMRLLSSGKGSASELAETMGIAADQAKEGGALMEEYRKKTDTLAAQTEILGNQIVALGIDFGESLLPQIKETVELLQNPDLTLGEKVQGVMDQIGEIFKKAAPVIAEIGGEIGLGLVEGIWAGFWGSNLLGKLFIGGALLRMFGGPTLLQGAGTRLAAPITAGLSKAVQTQIGIAHLTSIQAAQREAAFRQRGWAGVTGFDRSVTPQITKSAGMFANALAFTMQHQLAVAFGVGGIVNILSDVIGGDWEGAAFELGGGIAGAIAGGIAGGLPGALVGFGIGTILGDMFDDATRQTFGKKDFANRIEENAKAATASVTKLADDYSEAAREVARAKKRESKASDRQKEAEEDLKEVRQKYPHNARRIARAERRVAEAKHESEEASRALEKAERVPEVEREFRSEALRRHLADQQADLVVKRRTERQYYAEFKALNKSNSSFEERQQAYDKWQGSSDDLADSQRAVNRTLSRAHDLIGPKFAKDLQGMADKLGRAALKSEKADQNVDRLSTSLKNAALAAGGSRGAPGGAILGLQDLNETLGDAEGKAARTQKKLDKLATEGLDPLNDKTRKTAQTTKESTGQQEEDWKELNTEVLDVIGSMRAEIGSILSDLGVKDATFSTETEKGKQKKQAGGFTVPGRGVGDKMLTKVWTEPDEDVFVLNKKAAMERRSLQKWNSMFPRHGIPKRQGGGLATGIQALGANLINRFGGSISSGYRPGDDGFHGQGLAIDYVPSDWRGASKYANSIGGSLLEGIYNPATFGGTPVSWDAGSQVSSGFWGSEWGNHLDHLHLAMGANQSVRAAKAVKTKLKNRLMKGPKGAMTNIGQGAIDRTTAAGNKFLAGQMPAMVSHGNVSRGAMSLGEIAKVWNVANRGQGNAATMARIAMAESSGNPAAIGHDPGGTQGLGLWQITTGFNDDLIAKYGGRGAMLTPIPNAKAAGDILARQGLTAWVVHNTGAAYAQQGGKLPSLDRGGRVEEMGLAKVHRGDVHMGEPKIEVNLYGPGWDKFVSQMEVVVDGKQQSVNKHNIRMARQRGR